MCKRSKVWMNKGITNDGVGMKESYKGKGIGRGDGEGDGDRKRGGTE